MRRFFAPAERSMHFWKHTGENGKNCRKIYGNSGDFVSFFPDICVFNRILTGKNIEFLEEVHIIEYATDRLV